ncbi:hypothetical protein OAF27_03140, partial [Verrucomicrobiales bacterium]|nr:hypothetical protein [Verrucomicrobiales bacterium]
ADTMVVFDHRFRVMHIVANIIPSEHASTDDAYEAAREKIDGVIAKLSQPLQVTPMPFGRGSERCGRVFQNRRLYGSAKMGHAR